MSCINKIIPFNEFWMNCILNSAYSIATTKDNSYADAAYINNYSYSSWEAAIDPEFISPTIEVLNYADKWESFVLCEVIETEIPVFFEDTQNFLVELQQIISEQKIVRLHVDLFYWLPKNIAWNRFHMSHYSIINGYDTEKREYFILDDDIDGYGTHVIPEERLIKAFYNSNAMIDPDPATPHAYVYCIRDSIVPYKISITEVKSNAERIVEELSVYSFENLWNFKEDKKDEINEYINISLIGINIIENRHIGNGFLSKRLVELELINSTTFENMKTQLAKLQRGWKTIKQVFINSMVSDTKEINIDLIRSKANEMLSREKEMWLALLEEK
ncbi:hypothetical protein [Paenibacillus paeoniae]|uniref:Butirosin biosynthesis protein H N-terminal domain-containing protein n=1 Tax=Paenibacillus paeoniae TaxID=2292705 RepID=A0A371NZI7_9BACL|nr:hypothetical protein [Paenibacillus paeoniae]REK69097.1 hypothetical protein DX130_26075 [Paenibacillus paeoniae]